MNENEGAPSILSDRQRKFLGFVLCCAGVLLLGVLIAVLVVILNRAFDTFGGVIWSLAVSGMLAIMLRPIVTFFDEKLGLGRFASILLLYLLVVAVAGSATWYLGERSSGRPRSSPGRRRNGPSASSARSRDPFRPTPGKRYPARSMPSRNTGRNWSGTRTSPFPLSFLPTRRPYTTAST